MVKGIRGELLTLVLSSRKFLLLLLIVSEALVPIIPASDCLEADWSSRSALNSLASLSTVRSPTSE